MPETHSDNQELFEHFRFEADKGQAPLRIDKFLGNKMEGTSRNRIQSAADAGSILVNGIPVKSNYKVKPLDVVSIVLPHPPRKLELIPEDIPINIVYEDDLLLVINKEPGMVVHPGHGNYTGTLVNALMHHLKDH
jgi:23S rRNA pseudouridine1911/1915/1917 synthase